MKGRKIVALAGGVGGAKLALGLAGVLPAEELTVAVNTADDFEHRVAGSEASTLAPNVAKTRGC